MANPFHLLLLFYKSLFCLQISNSPHKFSRPVEWELDILYSLLFQLEFFQFRGNDEGTVRGIFIIVIIVLVIVLGDSVFLYR